VWRRDSVLCEGSETRRVTVDQGRVFQGGIEVGELGELGKGGEGGELLRSWVDALTPNRHHSQRASSLVRWRGALWSLRRHLQFRVSAGWKGAVGGELTELTELPGNQGTPGDFRCWRMIVMSTLVGESDTGRMSHYALP
jgi:hypothetical protein